MSTTILNEFIEKLSKLENEQRLLAEDRKALVEDYKEKIDMKALMAAIRIVKIKSKLGASESDCENYIEQIDGKIS